MENLIKTKKLETRFFLTTAAQQAAQGGVVKPQTAAASFSKSKNGLSSNLNATAPINFHMGQNAQPSSGV